jgi:hypothetical protein
MTRTGQTMQKAEARSGMGVTAVVALATDMQVEMPMNRGIIVMMLMAMQLESESGTDRQSTHQQESDAHQKFGPCRHCFDMDEVFQADRSEGEHHNANRMTSPPSQPSAQGSDGLSQ